MKSKLIALSIMIVSSSTLSVANAADGTINFTGNIIDPACTVNPASASQTIALGTVSSNALATSGATAAPTAFSIALTDCAVAGNVSVKFDGTHNTSNPDLLAITSGAGVATNVGIALYEQDGTTQIPLNTASAAKPIVGSSPTGTATLNYIAKYMATGQSTAGIADGVTQFSVIYN